MPNCREKSDCDEMCERCSCLLSSAKEVASPETMNTLWAVHFKKCGQSELDREKQIQDNMPENINHKGKLKE